MGASKSGDSRDDRVFTELPPDVLFCNLCCRIYIQDQFIFLDHIPSQSLDEIMVIRETTYSYQKERKKKKSWLSPGVSSR